MIFLLASLHWNPDPVVFTIPFLNHPVVWYGLWFVFGFIVGYYLLRAMFRKLVGDASARLLLDRLSWFMVGGTLIGARLGHVFFYDWPYYRHHLLEIFTSMGRGLASHGATLGILLALFFYRRTIAKKYPRLTFLVLMDMIVVATAFAGSCIRIGNFFNQEILGIATTMPWGVIFGNPIDGITGFPRHPVQLYEAINYFADFLFLLYAWWRTDLRNHPGCIGGLFFICIFTTRFFLDFFKAPQSHVFSENILQAGQILSLPLIFLGIGLFLYGQRVNLKAWKIIS